MTRVVLSGSVLCVWDRVERQLRGGQDESKQKIQTCRLRTNDGQASTVGILVPYECVDQLSYELALDAERIEKIDLTNGMPKSELQIEPKVEVKIESQIDLTIVPKMEVKIEPKPEPITVPQIESENPDSIQEKKISFI